MGTLFVVATPIGNLEDLSLRALRVLREVDQVIAEDTRVANVLLRHYGITKRLLSYNEHNKSRRLMEIIGRLEGSSMALITDAGTPGISDPGVDLVAAVRTAGHDVVAIPGPSAVVAALTASGLPAREFMFAGFLPRRAGDRRKRLDSLARQPQTIVAFESPHRLRRTLSDMLLAWGDRRIAVCRELTKAFEEVFRGTISQALQRFAEPRGEFTLVIEGASEERPQGSEDDARRALRRLKAQGITGRDAVREVSQETGLAHRDVYRLWVEVSSAGKAAREAL